jgi:hypothetical protein
MAIICLAEVVAKGNPATLVEGIKRKVWKKSIKKKNLNVIKRTCKLYLCI